MKVALVLGLLAAACYSTPTATDPHAKHSQSQVTYKGLLRNGVEVFLGIPYGQDTGGPNRFKPPRPFVPESGSTIVAQSYGPSCPQPASLEDGFPLVLSEAGANVSEDCLSLNVARPKGTTEGEKLPVLVWIHGGSFWTGSNAELSTSPDGLVLESVQDGLPVMHVAINYRLGFFGFALSDALRKEGSTNAALRDQRLAIEWVRDHIEIFGGDPSKITIFGQSSGGLAVGIQTLAYGGEKPVPFQQGICQSQALEPGITGNFTINEMQLLVDEIGCNSSDLHSPDTIDCLRNKDTGPLLNASVAVHVSDISNNIGDSWLPVVDGDFLPAAPSTLVAEGRFANVTTIIGWTDDDLAHYTPTNISTEEDTFNFVATYLPDMKNDSITDLLELYPASDFTNDPSNNLSDQFFRSSRIFRDVLMTCMPIWYGENLAQRGSTVYLYDFNQTMFDPIFEAMDTPALGPVHGSEFAYVFGNISHYDVEGYPFHPRDSDYRLQTQTARSWATFASLGRPSLEHKQTLKGWGKAFPEDSDETRIFVIGGGSEGLSTLDGSGSSPALAAQKLKDRCAFLNSKEIRRQLRF